MNVLPFAMIGSMEILVIAVVVLVLFGAKKVPELMKGVGTGIKEFKKASRDVQEELHRAIDEADHTPPTPPSPPPAPRPPPDSLAQSAQDKPDVPPPTFPSPPPAPKPAPDSLAQSAQDKPDAKV